MIRGILIILVSVFFSSCKESMPSDIIKPARMQEVLWDVLRASALAQQIVNTDSSRLLLEEKSKLTRKVFLIHNITQAQFEKSYSYYTQHPDILKTMLDSLNSQKINVSTLNNWEKRKRSSGDSAKIN